MLNGIYGFGLRLGRVFWNDLGAGVMRHADAGYEIAKHCAKELGLDLPMVIPPKFAMMFEMVETAVRVPPYVDMTIKCGLRP